MAKTKTHERNRLKDFRTLSNRITNLAIHGLLRIDFLQKVSEILTEFSKCDGIEMWLVERGKFYRSSVTIPPNESFQFDPGVSGDINSISSRNNTILYFVFFNINEISLLNNSNTASLL